MPQRLSLKGMMFTCSILWGAAVLLVAFVNRLLPGYGNGFLQMVASIYPWARLLNGREAIALAMTGCALLDGAVCGLLFAWIYNCFIPKTK